MLLPKGNLTHPNCSGVSRSCKWTHLMIYIDYTVPILGFLDGLYKSTTLTLWQLSEERSQRFSPGTSGFEQVHKGYERKPSSRHDPQQNRLMAHIFNISFWECNSSPTLQFLHLFSSRDYRSLSTGKRLKTGDPKTHWKPCGKFYRFFSVIATSNQKQTKTRRNMTGHVLIVYVAKIPMFETPMPMLIKFKQCIKLINLEMHYP